MKTTENRPASGKRALKFLGRTLTVVLVTALLLIWCVLSFSSVSIFLYFNF